MRLITAFAVSFMCSAIIGIILFPAQTPVKSKPLVRPPAVTARSLESATKPYVILPAPSPAANPFSGEDAYDAARQMMLKGQLRQAQKQYLLILLTKSSFDQEAMRGLARVQGVLAHGDVAVLQQQAEAYRRSIARGSDTEEGYTPKALELLAEANLLAAQDIQATQATKIMPVASTVPVVSGIPQNTLPGPGSRERTTKPAAPPAFVQQVVRVGSALTHTPVASQPPAAPQLQPLVLPEPPAGPQPPAVERPSSTADSTTITIPVPVGGSPSAPAGAGHGGQGGTGSTSTWGASPTSSSPGSSQTQGGSSSSWGSGP